MGTEYRQEFFDRTYTFREAYGRAWQYARRYRLRISVGIVCGMLTAGTLVPIFTIVKPALEKVSRSEQRMTVSDEKATEKATEETSGAKGTDGRAVAPRPPLSPAAVVVPVNVTTILSAVNANGVPSYGFSISRDITVTARGVTFNVPAVFVTA